ncbi:cysteine--tRNA ligase [Candidatus Saccharibacteria bacterium QS_5_54_17]|nr:MAG: cysteine--tRNA ligase [Candidatus Saccharibacteria bacterium QS_5_54_17]
MNKTGRTLRLHNSLKNQKEDFQPLSEAVRVYSCGPTVYDHIHIGNLRGFIAADMLRRALTVNGYQVEQVMNFTDVDDKTIGRARQMHPDQEPLRALKRLTSEYSDIFLAEMEAIGNATEALSFVNATDSLASIQDLITSLYEAGFAYLADDGIYFSIHAYQNSGKTYGRLVTVDAANTGQARIAHDEYDKNTACDFALWKIGQEGEPAWEFRLGNRDMTGRPGWHIECSAMSTAQLGQPFDIHTGGVDLMFPHHENEIAQSTAGQSVGQSGEYARYFMHNEHLLVENQKMAKSKDNFVTLPDIENRGVDPLAFRLLVLQAHYRSQINFTWDSLDAAQRFLSDIRRFADMQFQPVAGAGVIDVQTPAEQIKTALADDMDTPAAIAALSQVVDATAAIPPGQVREFQQFITFLDGALGLDLGLRGDITDKQKTQIQRRQEARAQQDYDTADAIRDELAGQGIHLRDTPRGVMWHRLTRR